MNLPTLHYHKFESQIAKFNKIEDSIKRSVIKRQASQIANYYKWLQVTTSDYNWLRARLQVPSSNYNWLRVIMKDYQWLRAGLRLTTSHFKWLRVTTSQATSDYKRLPVKLRMTTTGIGKNLRHKNVYCFLWLHNNERSKYVENRFKNSCATLLVKIIEKYLRCRNSPS